jgi:hypothetical protein
MTQNRKELLELAARAAGYEISPHLDFENRWIEGRSKMYMKNRFGRFVHWDPTADDGDCARLEAETMITVEWMTDRAVAHIWIDEFTPVEWGEVYADHNNDRQAARRLASTRAAAEVGRGTP